WHRRLLRARRERPRRRRAAEQRDELATFHSITSSARARGGTFSKMRPKQTPAVIIDRLNPTGLKGMVGPWGLQQTPPPPLGGPPRRIWGQWAPRPAG